MSAAAPVPTSIGQLPIRIGHLKALARSPAHAKYLVDQELAGVWDFDDTASKRLGRLAHSIALGTKLPAVFPGERRGTKEWKMFVASNPGRDIVKQDEYDAGCAIADSLIRHPEAFELLQGEREKSILFEVAGRMCRTTPDVHLPVEHNTELKSAVDASPARFPWAALRMGYYAQVAMQKDGIIAAGHKPPKRSAIVAVETKPPYVVAVYDLTPGAEDFGRRQWRLWFERFRVCEDSGHWPGYETSALEPPMESEPLIGADGEVID